MQKIQTPTRFRLKAASVLLAAAISSQAFADTGGLREVVPIEGAGLRFRASDPEHLAEAAIQVLGDPELSRRMVEEGLAHIRLFDWDEIAQQTLDLYEGLVAATDQA